MNDPQVRKRLLWIGVLGGALLVSLLFISAFRPERPGIEDAPVLRPDTFAAVAEPQTELAAPAAEGASFSLGGGEAFSLIWRVLLVIVIIAVSIAGLRWWGKRATGPRSGTGFLKVVDTLPISNGRSIHLVALGERVIAIGATAQQLTLLNELSEDEASEVLASTSRAADQPLANFAAELFQSMRTGATRRSGTNRQTVIGEDYP